MRKGARVCRGEAEEKGASGAAESGQPDKEKWWRQATRAGNSQRV